MWHTARTSSKFLALLILGIKYTIFSKFFDLTNSSKVVNRLSMKVSPIKIDRVTSQETVTVSCVHLVGCQWECWGKSVPWPASGWRRCRGTGPGPGEACSPPAPPAEATTWGHWRGRPHPTAGTGSQLRSHLTENIQNFLSKQLRKLGRPAGKG